MPEIKGINIENLDAQQRAELLKKLQGEVSVGQKAENERNKNELLSHANDQEQGSFPASASVIETIEQPKEAVSAKSVESSSVARAKALLNDFFQGEKSFEDLPVNEASAASIVEGLEHLDDQKPQ